MATTWKNPYPVASSAGPAADLKSLTSKTYPWTPPTGASGGSRLNPDGTIKPYWDASKNNLAMDNTITNTGAYDGMPSLKDLTSGSTNSWDWNQSNPTGLNYVAGSNGSTTTEPPKADTTTYINAMGPGEAKVDVTDYPADTTTYINAMGPGEEGVEITDAPSTEPPTVPNNKGDGQLTIDKNTGNIYRGYEFIGTLPGYENGPPDAPPTPEFKTPDYGPGYTPGAFETMYGTLGNIQDYMNPYLDKIIERGNKNILSNASAMGRLNSSGTDNQLGEWATQAQADAFRDAFGRFNLDRNYMTDAYRDGRDFDYDNYRDTNKWNYGLYNDEKADYEKRLSEWYKQLSGITDVGMNASTNASTLTIDQAKAIAALFGEGGKIEASKLMNMSSQQRDFIGKGLALIFGDGAPK